MSEVQINSHGLLPIENLKINGSKKFIEAYKAEISKQSNDFSKIFYSLPPYFKIATFLSMFGSSYLSTTLLSMDDIGSKARFSEEGLRATSSGPGGFFHAIFVYFPYIGQLTNDFADLDEKRRITMLANLALMLSIIGPACHYVFKLLYKDVENFGKYFAFARGLIWVANGFLLTCLSMYFGIALNYFINLALTKILSEKEHKASIESGSTEFTHKELLFRLSVGLAIGLPAAYLMPIINPYIMNLLNASFESPFVGYLNYFFITAVSLLGIHCLTIRILLPILKKISNKALTDKENKQKMILSIAFVLVTYVASIVLYGASSVLDNVQFLLQYSASLQNLVFQITMGVAIIVNILCFQHLFKIMPALVNEEKLSKKLLSADNAEKDSAKYDIKRNKIFGASLMFGGLLSITAALTILVYGEINGILEFSNYIKNPFIAIPLLLVLATMVFSGIVLYGKTALLESGLGDGELLSKLDKQHRILVDSQSLKTSINNGDSDIINQPKIGFQYGGLDMSMSLAA